MTIVIKRMKKNYMFIDMTQMDFSISKTLIIRAYSH